jgi:sugar/nucleoside kinase (ribokinase family)
MTPAPEDRSGVLCAGTLLVDYGKTIDAYPPRDGLATIGDISRSTGGAALNMAMDLRRLGATFEVGLVGCVADDDDGAHILEACEQAGVDVGSIRVEPGATTAFTDVMVEREGGRRTFFTYMGTNGLFELSARRLDGSRARILHVGNLGVHPLMDRPGLDGRNGWSRLLAAAQARGMHTNMELASLAPDRQVALAGPCLPHLDSIIVNELEASALVGASASAPGADDPVDWAGMEALARGLIDRGVSTIAVVHFPAGCVAATSDGRAWRQGSVRLAPGDAVSTTGAGDAFAAGVILGLHEDWSVDACLHLGAAAAAACITDPHTSNGIASAADCLAAADAMGYREARSTDGRRTAGG